jgi:hypothetical protein
MATAKLFGADVGDTITVYAGNNYICATKFTCDYTGSVTEIRIRVGGSGNVKVGLYADDSDNPGTLLASSGSTAVSIGWNIISVTPVNVTYGAAYWLAFNTDTLNLAGAKTDAGRRYQYKALTFSNPFPDPGGSGWTAPNGYKGIEAAWGALVLSPSGISQPVNSGSPKLGLSLKPSGIAQTIGLGSPVIVPLSPTIYPTGIAQGLAVGAPALVYPQVILPSGIEQPVTPGEPWIGLLGFLRPSGIEQQISIGSPSLYKYVWHVILDGRYNIESPDKNRFFVIGRDSDGLPVYGTAVDSTEAGLVGERLDFQQELAVTTGSQAASMAGALLSKMRLTGKSGVIVIPPNCGQELFDVVQISDFGANQQAVSFRVVGIRFEYNPKQARFEHRFYLGSP